LCRDLVGPESNAGRARLPPWLLAALAHGMLGMVDIGFG
jgi:hypothetical protein